MTDQAFLEGFMTKCSEVGIPQPQAEELLKSALFGFGGGGGAPEAPEMPQGGPEMPQGGPEMGGGMDPAMLGGGPEEMGGGPEEMGGGGGEGGLSPEEMQFVQFFQSLPPQYQMAMLQQMGGGA